MTFGFTEVSELYSSIHSPASWVHTRPLLAGLTLFHLTPSSPAPPQSPLTLPSHTHVTLKCLICMDPCKRCNVVGCVFVFLMYINDTLLQISLHFFSLKTIFIQHHVVGIYAFRIHLVHCFRLYPTGFRGQDSRFFLKKWELWGMSSS